MMKQLPVRHGVILNKPAEPEPELEAEPEPELGLPPVGAAPTPQQSSISCLADVSLKTGESF